MVKKVKIFLTTLCLLCLTGCYPKGSLEVPGVPDEENAASGNIAANGTDNSAAGVPDVADELSGVENLKFSLKYADSYPSEAPRIKINVKNFDADIESIKAKFLVGKTVTEENHYNNGQMNILTEDDSMLVISSDYLSFTSNIRSEVVKAQYFAVTNVINYENKFPHTDTELSGFSKAQALEKADGIIKEFDLKYLDNPRIYTMTSDDINNFNESEILSAKDDFYYIRYTGIYNGIPISNSNAALYKDVSNAYPVVDILLSKDELIKVGFCNIIEEAEESETVNFRIDARTAVLQLYNFYKNVEKLKFPTEFSEVSSVYFTAEADYDKGEFSYIPVWCIEGEQYIEKDDAYCRISRFVDPASGFVFNNYNL